jgi:hypothetical protein
MIPVLLELNIKLPVIVLVRHTLVDGSVSFDVYNITYFVIFEISRQLDWSLGSEISGKQVTSSGSQSERVWPNIVSKWFVCNVLYFMSNPEWLYLLGHQFVSKSLNSVNLTAHSNHPYRIVYPSIS